MQSKFKVGDQVKSVRKIFNMVYFEKVGVVVEVTNPSHPYRVVFNCGLEDIFGGDELELTEISRSPLWEALK